MMARRAVLLAACAALALLLPSTHAAGAAAVVDVEPAQQHPVEDLPLEETDGSQGHGRIPAVAAVDVTQYVGRWFQVRPAPRLVGLVAVDRWGMAGGSNRRRSIDRSVD